MHFVHTFALRTRPFLSLMVILWMLGRNQRFVTRCEWLMLRPATGCLPQTSQIFDIVPHSMYVRCSTALAADDKKAFIL